MEIADSEFMEKYDENNVPHDGTYVVNPLPCPEYANYRPWSTNNVERELIRTAPAYAAVTPGSETPALKWRYTTKYSSTDGTGQYVMVRDARITGGGEGNWVFVPRSCLSSTLPSNEGEAHDPLPPAVTTGTPTGIATPNATLVGSVNPHGIDTKYLFEYGTSTSYGKFTEPTGDAGAGTSTVQENFTVGGLLPGTTYYYRIVAYSATGESVGGPVAFTTQPPPTVTTSAASSVQEVQATLNGTVNGNGLNTTYHFEYGEATSYGSSTSVVGVASGGSSPSVTVIGLRPGTTYHYRIVATSTAGTSTGSDQTFKTLEVEASSRWAVRNPSSLEQWVYSPARGATLQEYFYTGSSWYVVPGWGPALAAGSTSAVVRDPSSGQQWVYYVASNDTLWEDYYNGTGWGVIPLNVTVAPGTSPTVVRDPGTGQQWVYYVASNGMLQEEYYNGSSFGLIPGWGPTVEADTSPTVIRNPSTGEQWVYYVANNGTLWEMYYNGSSWGPISLSAAIKAGTSPMAMRNASTGEQWVDYVASNDALWEMYYNGSSWAPVSLGVSGTAPTSVRDPGSAQQWMYYVASNGTLQEDYYNGSSWGLIPGWGPTVASGTTPTVVRNSTTGEQWLYYVASNGTLWEMYYNGSSWGPIEL